VVSSREHLDRDLTPGVPGARKRDEEGRQEEATMTSRPEEARTETEPERTPEEEPAEWEEPETPPIDEDVAGSVNAALPDSGDE
jgi:hypothetical protein